MRLLPTIFACNQLIKHHGILVNDEMITFYNYKVNLGDIVSIPKIQ
jgi:ribosomal protein S4